jgi:hypothetical protein
MTLDHDPLLPAAPFLMGDAAADAVGSAVSAVGGELLHLKATQMSYRPGRELVVQYAASVSWAGGTPRPETLLAGATSAGPPVGSLPVEAFDPVDGRLEVGVWRYPFDPELTGLASAVSTDGVAALVDEALLPQLEVVSYRPCRRAVVRAVWPHRTVYVKAVAPALAGALVDRHHRLAAAGLPVPEVVATNSHDGLVALAELPGADLRTRLFDADARIPEGADLVALVERIAAIDLDGAAAPARPSLLHAAPRHADLLARVVPEARGEIDRLLSALRDAPPVEALRLIHSDLHEAQLRVDAAGRIVGVLDVDDMGPGDPIDDLARATGHLLTLALLVRAAGDHAAADLLDARAVDVASGIERSLDNTEAFRTRVAASLIGLATGPFGARSPDWRERTVMLLATASAWLEASSG